MRRELVFEQLQHHWPLAPELLLGLGFDNPGSPIPQVNFVYSYRSCCEINMVLCPRRSGRSSVGARTISKFIINPIVDIGFGVNGDVTFAPVARLARNFGENFALGVE